MDSFETRKLDERDEQDSTCEIMAENTAENDINQNQVDEEEMTEEEEEDTDTVILRSQVLFPKPRHLPHVQLGEHFEAGRYTHDDRIGMWVGCVYSPTEGWVHHHEWVLYPDQLDRIRKTIDTNPNGKTGLFEIVDQKGKVVLYTDRHGHNRW